MLPPNLAQGKKAYNEAVNLAKTIPFEPLLLASSESTAYDHIPDLDPASIDKVAAHVYITRNNTIEGTSLYNLPYAAIYDGHWAHNNHRYITFHRIAVSAKARGRGSAQTFLQGLIDEYDGPEFRCDMHKKNKAMQHILEKLGYHYCGKVVYEGERLAYQKIKSKAEKGFYQEVDEAEYHILKEMIKQWGSEWIVFSVKTFNNINQVGLQELGN